MVQSSSHAPIDNPLLSIWMCRTGLVLWLTSSKTCAFWMAVQVRAWGFYETPKIHVIEPMAVHYHLRYPNFSLLDGLVVLVDC